LTVEGVTDQSVLKKYPSPSNLDRNLKGTLWYSNDNLFATGNTSSGIQSFSTITNEWSFATISGDGVDFETASTSVQVASSQSSALGFSFGSTSPELIIFNTSNLDSPTWSNQIGSTVPLVLESEMISLLLGKSGVVLMMGGYTTVFLPLCSCHISLAKPKFRHQQADFP
jgi:hypothetical protein